MKVDLDLLLCTVFNLKHANLFLCPIFTQISALNWKIEQSYEQWAQLWSVTRSWESYQSFHFTSKKYLSSLPKLYKGSNPSDFEPSQYLKSGSTLSSSQPIPASSNCHWLGKALCLCLPVQPIQAVPGRLNCASPRALPLALILQSKSSMVYWNSLQKWLSGDREGLKLGLKLELCSLTNEF